MHSQGQSKDSQYYRAKRYSLLKYSLGIIDTLYLLILLFAFGGFGFSKLLARSLTKLAGQDSLVIPLYVLAVFIGYYIVSFPLHFYRSFILEHAFSLSNQRLADWWKDQCKGGVISYGIALVLIGAFYLIVKQYMYTWWLVISFFWILFSLILARLMPVLIIPLFFKYKKLSDDSLRERIMRLAEKMKIRILDCYQIDFSKKTLKANAAFVGWGATRRVILADTLKDKYSLDEIEVILAHEFAHYKLRHLIKLILANALVTMLVFYCIFTTSDAFLRVFGLRSLWDIAALPVLLIYFVVFGIAMQPFENYISRRFEKNADLMALKATGLKEAFISMMEKLSSQNLADRNPPRLIKAYFFDHPSVDERIALAKSQ